MIPEHFKVNKHKPWIETSYHGVITENMDTVLLDPPLVALDKDAPVPYAVDQYGRSQQPHILPIHHGTRTERQMVACCFEIEGAIRGTAQVLGSRPRTFSPKMRGTSVS
ncbi:Calsyntenin-2, partial [Dissostichus eleginoides]